MMSANPIAGVFAADLFRQAHALGDQGLDDLTLGHSLDHLSTDEDLALSVARRHAQVGLTSLTRSVDHTPHHGHAERHRQALESSGDLLGQLVHVDLGSPAGWA